MSDSFVTSWIVACQDPSVCGISQGRILEWVVISFSRGSSWPRDWPHVSCMGRRIPYHWATSCFSRVWLCETLWTAAHQAPLSVGFSRQEYWSGLQYPPPGDLPRGLHFSVVHGIFQQEYWSELPFLPPGDFPEPGIEPASPTRADRFLTTEPIASFLDTFISQFRALVQNLPE